VSCPIPPFCRACPSPYSVRSLSDPFWVFTGPVLLLPVFHVSLPLVRSPAHDRDFLLPCSSNRRTSAPFFDLRVSCSVPCSVIWLPGFLARRPTFWLASVPDFCFHSQRQRALLGSWFCSPSVSARSLPGGSPS
jgi:hypothetical protein